VIAIASEGCVAPPVSAPVIPVTSAATKQPMVIVALEPSIQVGDVSAVYVTATFPSPYPPVSGLDWVNPWASSNHVTVLQLKVPSAVSQSVDLIQPLDIDTAIAKAGGEKNLSSALDPVHLSSARHRGATKAAVGTFLGSFISAPTILISPVTTAGMAAYHAWNRGKTQLEDVSFPQSPLGIVNEKAGYFHWERIDFLSDGGPGAVGYLFFRRGNYSALEVTVEAPGATETIRCAWR